MSQLIQCHNLSFAAAGRTILQNVDLTISAGEIVSLIGPNGAGKTTLIRCLLGLEATASGTITRSPELRVGYMPQRLQTDPSLPLTVMRFLKLAEQPRDTPANALAETGAMHLAERALSALSGGELQRVLLARALLREPDLLVLDEPAQGVDIGGQEDLYRLIGKIRDRLGCGVLLISHDLHLVMASTDHVVCLNQHVCCHGHPQMVSADPAYLELFGEHQRAALVPYAHHHDHDHDAHGDVIKKTTG